MLIYISKGDMAMSDLKDIITSFKKLSFSERAAFYYTVSVDAGLSATHLQSFLIETRITDGHSCIHCSGTHVVKNGTRRDGTQRYLCRDCGKSFIPRSLSITSGTRKKLSVWTAYLRCMLEKKTLRESSEECGISMVTAFAWRHKILDALHDMTEKVLLDGTVEADETFFDVSYKGNHRQFNLPREARKRGGSVHTGGLSSEKVCVPCAVSEEGIAYARPAKLGKVSSECVRAVFDGVISPQATLCTDHEQAYPGFAREQGIALIQMDTGCRIKEDHGKVYGIQRINAYHSHLKGFIQRFRGVATKYLDNYITWNNLLVNSRRNKEEFLSLLLSELLVVRMAIRNRDIPGRAPLPGILRG